MSQYVARVRWQRNGQPFTDQRYSRAHSWSFDGGVTLPASSSPHVVPLPYSDPAAVDPEEAFVAALSSCHMLTFLWLAAKEGYGIDSYDDNAEGEMRSIGQGRQAVTSVTLKPEVVFTGNKRPSEEAVAGLHHQAHEQCFLANSVKTEIKVQGVWRYMAA